jgi:hypothetical protein
MAGRYIELSLDGQAPPAIGSLVEFQDSGTLYLGEIQDGWVKSGAHHVRVLIEHSVDLERAGAIRRLWNTDVPQ